MRRARIVHGAREIDVVVSDDGRLRATDGTILDPGAVRWLPPPTPLVLGLALNYADHAAELDFNNRPDHPILFIKNPSSLVGHLAPVVRPAGVEYMHYEGELGVVIGRPARKVRRGDAFDYVSGYTVCNDVTVRDFVENFYRPPVKAKGFDTFGPIGPWIVDAADVAHPQALAVRTWVNGELRQDGNTRDLIFDVPALIEYASEFMTLPVATIISTGTPRGISNVVPGDVMVVEVEGVGRLENAVVAEEGRP
jgi:5-oxopent-3-ene-1,2,5-tricarboxylate decarboxylase/2-hydroxyhepta-2,4-diene-1,7-dioate isomerase